MTTETIEPFVGHPSQRNTTWTVTPLYDFTDIAGLLISHSMSTIIDKQVAVTGTNTTGAAYTIKKNTQVA